jgi:hypothetical protein
MRSRSGRSLCERLANTPTPPFITTEATRFG